MIEVKLSSEQEAFISFAAEGKNILVDACIGSGKTTTIQRLCDTLPQNLDILYLTYSKLLRLDAKAKIKNGNVDVTNYHKLAQDSITCSVGVSELVETFNKEKPRLKYDVLIIDEYQDIEQDYADMLKIIKADNPKMQIIAVGDMAQKIYDTSYINVSKFMDELLGEHMKLEFTKCFRISEKLAKHLGEIWGKKISGENKNCIVKQMTEDEVVRFLGTCDPKDVLCLGANNKGGARVRVFNKLCERYPEKFNKHTAYSSISDEDDANIQPGNTAAIFTTFDRSKGLEREICVVFNFTNKYWQSRISKPAQRYDILRNIFCVAASRGKGKIIFVDSDKDLNIALKAEVATNINFEDVAISDMFDHKKRIDVRECYKHLDTKKIDHKSNHSEIDIKSNDGYIDLSPCIGIYQEAVFFSNHDIGKEVRLAIAHNKSLGKSWEEFKKLTSLDEEILFHMSLITGHDHYRTQAIKHFVDETASEKIYERLSEVFNADEEIQSKCRIGFGGVENEAGYFSAFGLADVVKDNKVYELKFVTELTTEHFLQCACYIVALNLEVGILWNVRNNEMHEIRIKDKDAFLDAIVKAVTKGFIKTYQKPAYSDIILTTMDKDSSQFSDLLCKMHFKDYDMVMDNVGKAFMLKDFVIRKTVSETEAGKKDTRYENILISDTGLCLYTTSSGERGMHFSLNLVHKLFCLCKPLEIEFVKKEGKKEEREWSKYSFVIPRDQNEKCQKCKMQISLNEDLLRKIFQFKTNQ